MSDLELARRVAAGEEPAAEAFFGEYFPRLYRFACARLGGDHDGAEEVVQATMIRGVRKLHTFRGEAALFTWLCTICRREISEWRQRHRCAGEVALVDDHPAVRAALDAATLSRTDPEHEAGRRELAQLVRAALDRLPNRYGQVLEWRYVQGLAVDEIAGRLGLGYKAAESLLSRARLSFREVFDAGIGGWPARSPGVPARTEEA